MLLRDDLTLALDPVLFAHELGIVPDDWQAVALRSPSRRQLWNACRQSGKSTTAAIMALHRATFYDRSLVLMVSPSLRQSSELYRRVREMGAAAPSPMPMVEDTKTSLTMSNGSRIVSLPSSESTIRGYSAVDLLIFDEASRVEDPLYYSTRPMLAVSGGTIAALSTPFGTRGWWYEAWRSSEPWERVEIPATTCSRISAAFLAEEQRTLGAFWFEQEYLCKFVEAESQAFRRADIERAFSEEVEAWAL